MTVHRIQVAAAIVGITGVLLMYHVPVISGDLEPVLQRCCQSGEAWARNHTTCTGPPGEPGAVPAQDRLTCLTSLYICCIRSHRKTRCERGKEAATEGRQCGALDDSFRDCCDGCSLGIQAAISRMPCSFARFSFGAPWDEAYIDCCEKFSAPQGISQQTRKVTCEPNYPCSQVCDVVDNQIKCSCYPGFTLAQDQATCQDVDECQLNVHTCNPANEFCSNLVGGFKCMPKDPAESEVCRPGLIMNQQTQTCEDFDECTMQPCARNQVCVNTYGSFTCEYKGGSNDPPALVSLCSAGFAYNENNGLCIDVDECAEGTHTCNRTSEICQNSHGGFQCLSKPTRSRDCPAGFKWNENSGSCEDFDECREELHGCDVDKSCRNTVGGYECEPKCFLLMKFDPVQNKCVESNACVDGLHDCKPDEACIATMDAGLGYVCIPKTDDIPCPPGFKPSGPNNEICDDINECEEFPDICDEREMCINGIGSYDCVAKSDPTKSQPQQVQTCPLGMQFDEQRRKCVDIDECLQNIDRCNRTTQDCVNYNGTYECVDKATNVNRCPPGYQSDSRTGRCEDIDECTGGRHKCLPDKEECVNVPGAYRCQQKTASKPCPPGHRFNTSSNTCRDVDECSEGAHTCSPSTQNCVNAVGSYRCVTKASCPHGYKWSGNKCEDVNECAEFDHDCDTRTHYCVNTPGSYQCQTKNARAINCGSGFVFDTSRNTCTDINECESVQPCSEDQVCENTIGSYVCNCPPGFILDVVTRLCKDLNECQLGMHVCADSQRCDNTVGSYTCVRMTSCGTGYTLNAATSHCEDDDECALNTHNCGPGFSCRNIQGSFRCDRVKCPPGQKLLSDGSCKVVVCGRGMEPDDAGNCIDINECALDNTCRTNQRCINTVGSYRCQNLLNCSPGYELNEFGNQCIDVDECARRIYECGPLQTCRNRPGGYVCECPRGYALNLQRECEDVDECTRFRGQVCSRMSECVNTQGSYVCNCKEGFRKADDDKNCVDIDECAESPNICQQVCNNVWGSYQCSCQAGFTLGPDNRSCQDIDECKTYEGHGDLCIGYCVNEPGSFSCSCPPGYRLSSDKRTCQDIDECQEQNVCSGDKQVCLNTRGGYKCNRIVCPPNYVRDKDHRKDPVNPDDTVVCRKRCRSNDIDCILNGTQTITYQTIALPTIPYLPHPLILTTMRAVTSRNTGRTFRTDFQIVEGNEHSMFDILKGEGVGSLRLARSIRGPQELLLKILMTIHMNPTSRNRYASTSRHVAAIEIIVSEHDF